MGNHRELISTVWVIAGAECSGKTTLFESLKPALPNFQFVSEYNRDWLEKKSISTPFDSSVLDQLFDECLAFYQNIEISQPIIFDTDLLNLYLWAKHIRHPKMMDLFSAWEKSEYNYILCPPLPNFEWDELRSGPEIQQWSWHEHLLALKKRRHFVLQSNDADSKLKESIKIISLCE